MDFERVRRSAYAYALKRGFAPEQAEDFAQDVCLERHKGRVQPLKYHFADHARMWRVRGGGYVDSIQNYSKIYDCTDLEALQQWRAIESWPITKIERVVVLLIARFGLKKEDVAYLLKITPARVSQLIGKIKLRMAGNKVGNV